MSELDKDFDAVVEQINAKLKEAAAAVREANKLSSQIGVESLVFSAWMREELSYKLRKEGLKDSALWDKMDEEAAKYEKFSIRELESEMSSAGWSMSSSHC
jgi:hypothetical protein